MLVYFFGALYYIMATSLLSKPTNFVIIIKHSFKKKMTLEYENFDKGQSKKHVLKINYHLKEKLLFISLSINLIWSNCPLILPMKKKDKKKLISNLLIKNDINYNNG